MAALVRRSSRPLSWRRDDDGGRARRLRRFINNPVFIGTRSPCKNCVYCRWGSRPLTSPRGPVSLSCRWHDQFFARAPPEHSFSCVASSPLPLPSPPPLSLSLSLSLFRSKSLLAVARVLPSSRWRIERIASLARRRTESLVKQPGKWPAIRRRARKAPSGSRDEEWRRQQRRGAISSL